MRDRLLLGFATLFFLLAACLLGLTLAVSTGPADLLAGLLGTWCLVGYGVISVRMWLRSGS